MVEIPTDSATGINLPALSLALNELPVKAVIVSSSVQNPLGCSMDDESRQRLTLFVSLCRALATLYSLSITLSTCG